MLTGHGAVPSATVAAVTRKIASEPYTPLGVYLADVRPGVAAVVDRALQKNPADRYGSAQELARGPASAAEERDRGRIDARSSVGSGSKDAGEESAREEGSWGGPVGVGNGTVSGLVATLLRGPADARRPGRSPLPPAWPRWPCWGSGWEPGAAHRDRSPAGPLRTPRTWRP
ncbi:MAG: hypothetical protein R2991_09910 [Thermoanaerobaculia bacterium]